MGLMFPIYFISLILSAGLALMSASQVSIVITRYQTKDMTKIRP